MFPKRPSKRPLLPQTTTYASTKLASKANRGRDNSDKRSPFSPNWAPAEGAQKEIMPLRSRPTHAISTRRNLETNLAMNGPWNSLNRGVQC